MRHLQNYNTMVPLYYYHGLVQQSLYNKVASDCCNNNTDTCNYYKILNGQSACAHLISKLLNQGAGLDPYNLYK